MTLKYFMKSIVFYVIIAYFKCIYNGIFDANLLIKTYKRLITSLVHLDLENLCFLPKVRDYA